MRGLSLIRRPMRQLATGVLNYCTLISSSSRTCVHPYTTQHTSKYTVLITEQTAEGEMQCFSGCFDREWAAEEYLADLSCLWRPSLRRAICSFRVIPLDVIG